MVLHKPFLVFANFILIHKYSIFANYVAKQIRRGKILFHRYSKLIRLSERGKDSNFQRWTTLHRCNMYRSIYIVVFAISSFTSCISYFTSRFIIGRSTRTRRLVGWVELGATVIVSSLFTVQLEKRERESISFSRYGPTLFSHPPLETSSSLFVFLAFRAKAIIIVKPATIDAPRPRK